MPRPPTITRWLATPRQLPHLVIPPRVLIIMLLPQPTTTATWTIIITRCQPCLQCPITHSLALLWARLVWILLDRQRFKRTCTTFIKLSYRQHNFYSTYFLSVETLLLLRSTWIECVSWSIITISRLDALCMSSYRRAREDDMISWECHPLPQNLQHYSEPYSRNHTMSLYLCLDNHYLLIIVYLNTLFIFVHI